MTRVDDRAATAAQHLRDRRAHPSPHARQVDVEDPLEVVLAHLLGGSADRHTDVVEHHVETSPPVDGLADERLDVRHARHVGANEDGLVSGVADLLRGALAPLLGNIADHDTRALRGERFGRCAADAVGAAGDDRDLPVEPTHLASSTRL